MTTTCRRCGATFDGTPGPRGGRPRVYCQECAGPGTRWARRRRAEERRKLERLRQLERPHDSEPSREAVKRAVVAVAHAQGIPALIEALRALAGEALAWADQLERVHAARRQPAHYDQQQQAS